MKIWLLATLLLAIFCHIQGDTKILHEVEIISDDAFRKETFSLKNENSVEELIIEGTLTQTIRFQNNRNLVYRIETIYVADKNGNRAVYKITREPDYAAAPLPVVELNASSLKALGG